MTEVALNLSRGGGNGVVKVVVFAARRAQTGTRTYAHDTDPPILTTIQPSATLQDLAMRTSSTNKSPHQEFVDTGDKLSVPTYVEGLLEEYSTMRIASWTGKA